MKDSKLFWRRLTSAGKIISESDECSTLDLARKLEHLGIPTTPITIDKIRKYILEMFPDIEFRKEDGIYYVYTKFDDVSVSTEKERSSNESLR